MASVRVVPAFDEIEDGDPGLSLVAESTPIEQFAFERGKETFAERIVVTVDD